MIWRVMVVEEEDSEEDASRMEEDTWLIISLRDMGTVIWEFMSISTGLGVSSSVADNDDERRLVEVEIKEAVKVDTGR